MVESFYFTTLEFEELKCVGKGNFGSAFLARSRKDNQPYIAKKIQLGNLSEKEQESALLEANLLKSLKHANVVGYKDSFVEKGILTIVMEYCEVGDLSYHIKRRQKDARPFDEDLIWNWFIQICLALEFIHGRKVLHRDIKSSNIFLTGNNTVKLGDFGISKVLENTNEHAMTVIGTPYYMSPEVCENKPYTFKSDVWALGCVLYELCMLSHAFSAENLLGLVYKIVAGKFDPIPQMYSDEMRSLINLLLEKDVAKRPTCIDILRMPFVLKKIKAFIESGGKPNEGTEQLHVRMAIPEKPMPQRKPVEPKEEEKLTHKERIRRKKMQMADKIAKERSE